MAATALSRVLLTRRSLTRQCSVRSRAARWFRGTFSSDSNAEMKPLPPPAQRVGGERVWIVRMLAVYGDLATTATLVISLGALAYYAWHHGPTHDEGALKRRMNRLHEHNRLRNEAAAADDDEEPLAAPRRTPQVAARSNHADLPGAGRPGS